VKAFTYTFDRENSEQIYILSKLVCLQNNIHAFLCPARERTI